MMAALSQRLRVMPAVVVTVARQMGKSTLVKVLTLEKRSYFSLDDMDIFELASRNPEALVGGAHRHGDRMVDAHRAGGALVEGDLNGTSRL